MSRFGLFLLGLSVAVCAFMFASLPNVRDPIALFSQFLGSAALILMAWAQIMATRLPGIETVFGGMDRVYVLHKWTGILVLVMILLHDTIDAEISGLGVETALVELGETLGELSLYGLLVLGVISVATFIPYHLWKWTHRLMGAFFVAGSVHYILELKPFGAFADPTGLYVSAFCLMGALAYAYTLLPEGARRSLAYEVTQLRQTGGATQITLKRQGRQMRHQPGQFAIFSFAQKGLAEPHPYSLSAPPKEDGSLEITVKALGDYTHRLGRDLSVGTLAHVQGPFGRFTRHGSRGPELWIAAGIGITPFLAWLEALDEAQTEPIHLFWAVRSRDEAPHLDRVMAVAHPAVTVHLFVSSEGARVSGDGIAEVADLHNARAWFCGPAPMRRMLQRDLARHGISARRFHYEEFEFRTGIGLRRLSAWLGAKAAQS